MPLMRPDEMRTFAKALPHADFSHVNGGLPATLPGVMDELKDPNDFIRAWAPEMIKFGTDFLDGIEAFRTIALRAADAFETTDADHAAVMTDLVNNARTDQSPTTGDLAGLPHTRPPTGPLGPLFPPADPPRSPTGTGYNPYAGGVLPR